MTIDTRIAWLKAGAFFTAVCGLLIAAAAIPALQYPIEVSFDLLYYPVDQGQSMNTPVARLFSAFSGGLLVGLGVMLWIIASELGPGDPALARRLILLGLGSWYVVDSSMSVAAGAPLNVVSNTAFLLIFLVPAWGLGKTA